MNRGFCKSTLPLFQNYFPLHITHGECDTCEPVSEWVSKSMKCLSDICCYLKRKMISGNLFTKRYSFARFGMVNEWVRLCSVNGSNCKDETTHCIRMVEHESLCRSIPTMKFMAALFEWLGWHQKRLSFIQVACTVHSIHWMHRQCAWIGCFELLIWVTSFCLSHFH